jgi:hypothetical protein
MSGSETIYTARLIGPEIIEAGRDNVVSCPVYLNGAVVTPLAGTLTIYTSQNVAVSAGSVTVVGGVARGLAAREACIVHVHVRREADRVAEAGEGRGVVERGARVVGVREPRAAATKVHGAEVRVLEHGAGGGGRCDGEGEDGEACGLAHGLTRSGQGRP